MVFLLAHIVPGDPVQQMLGEGARLDDLREMRHALGLDVPVAVQYGRYLTGVVHGNFGESFRFQQPVAGLVLSHFPATLELAFVALLVCAAIGIPAGILAAARRGEPSDHAIGVLTLLGLSVPNFALGPVLILVFSVLIGWLPVSGRGGISHLVLPAVTLGAALAAILTRMVRTAVIEAAFERLRAHRSCEGPVGTGGSVSPRFSQRAHSDSDDSRLAIRYAAGRRDCYRNNFFVAGSRAARGAGHRIARLSVVAGMHTSDRGFLCGCESCDRPSIMLWLTRGCGSNEEPARISQPEWTGTLGLRAYAAAGVFGDCGAVDFARRPHSAKSCCSTGWPQRSATGWELTSWDAIFSRALFMARASR